MELKPCPFCGNTGTFKLFDVFGVKWFYVKCVECGAEINDPAPSEEMAAIKWNRRTNNG